MLLNYPVNEYKNDNVILRSIYLVLFCIYLMFIESVIDDIAFVKTPHEQILIPTENFKYAF